jgi:hypothetical protein
LPLLGRQRCIQSASSRRISHWNPARSRRKTQPGKPRSLAQAYRPQPPHPPPAEQPEELMRPAQQHAPSTPAPCPARQLWQLHPTTPTAVPSGCVRRLAGPEPPSERRGAPRCLPGGDRGGAKSRSQSSPERGGAHFAWPAARA